MQNTHQVPPSLKPSTCFVISMFYGMMSDGEIDPEEMGYLSTIMGGKRVEGAGFHLEPSAVVDEAMLYVKTHNPQHFLKQISDQQLLNSEQKLFILTHMISMAYSDGQMEPQEGKVIAAFKSVFGVPDDHFTPLYTMLKFKYNKAVVGL